MAGTAKARVYFCSRDITVSAVALTTGDGAFPLDDIAGVRTQRVRPSWMGPLGVFLERYLLILRTRGGGEIVALCRRNGYFIWKLAHAIEAAIGDAPWTQRSAGTAWAHCSTAIDENAG
jgi:hypothetical protein